MRVDGAASGGAPGDEPEGGAITLSTGQTVELPLDMEATMVCALFSAPRGRATAMLPRGLEPVPVTPRGNAAVLFMSVEYHHVGVDGLAPYDEFVVIVPASPESPTAVGPLSLPPAAVGGYVWDMPVTTEAATALGREVWGFPKSVGSISHADAGSLRETTVRIDGEPYVELSVDRPSTRDLPVEGDNYAIVDGQLRRNRVEADGAVGVRPLTRAVSLTLGEHERADPLRDLDLGGRALARFVLDGPVRIFGGEPVGGA